MMTPSDSLEERRAIGRSARKDTPRSAHAKIGNTDRDPVQLLRENSQGRVEGLIPLRYGRMLASPFTFFRGSAIIQAHDLAATANSGFHFQICGDCHLMNFGGFATPERALAFDINDFDETAIGPWEWDLKRLAASLCIAVRHLGHGDRLADEVVSIVVQSYQRWMSIYSALSPLELWYELITFDRLERTTTSEDARQHIRSGIEKASRRTHETMLPKLASHRNGVWQIRDTPPGVFHVHGKNTLFTHDDDWLGLGDWPTLMAPIYRHYLKSLGAVRGNLLAHFSMQDVAFKVVGVGSVGTRCLVLLMVDPHEKPLFIQFKEASTSVISRYFEAPVSRPAGGPRAAAHAGRERSVPGLDDGTVRAIHLRASATRHESLSHARTLFERDVPRIRGSVRLGARARSCKSRRTGNGSGCLPRQRRSDDGGAGQLFTCVCRSGGAGLRDIP
jgi:hypothetical protein